MNRTSKAILTILSLAAAPAHAQDNAPLSAIDWLSRSVTPSVGDALDAPATAEPPVADSATSPDVTTTALDDPSPDPVGLLASDTTGLPATLWSASAEDTLVMLVQAEATTSLPAIQDFMKVLLLAEAAPPLGAGPDGSLFLARVDKLLDMGALPEAQALLEAAGPDTPQLFRRWFDVTLLTGTEDAACDVMEQRPAVAPTYPARIFCLARSGDWPAAALALNTHRALGDVTEEEEALLSRFLDAELFEGEAALPPPSRTSPLVFRMREAIGESMGTSSLPLAFAHADLRDTVGWKAQLEAAERLARLGALPAPVLVDLYTSRSASASGGLWDRVEAMQRFDTAITRNDPGAVSTHLPDAWQAMKSIRAETQFAELYAEKLLALPLSGEARDLATTIGFLSSNYEQVALDRPDADPFLRALARGEPQTAPASGPIRQAIQEAFNGAAPPEPLARLAANDQLGEALLRAIAIFNAGLQGDATSVTEGLAFFRSVGLEDLARRAGLQLVLLDRSL